MRLRKALLTASAFLATLGMVGCGAAGQARTGSVPGPVSKEELAGVTLKVGDQKGGSRALLEAAGLLDDVPYKIEWSTFTSGPPLLEAASAGAVDVGRVGNTPPIFAAAANANVAVVSAAKGDVKGDALLVPRDSPLTTVADLKGKTIGVAKGSSAHGQVLYTLQKAHLSTKDVRLSFLQPADAFGAFNQQQIDAWSVWDPYTAQAIQDSDARVLATGEGTANGYTFQVAGRTALSDAGKNSALRDYVLRVARAQVWADSHRDAWAKAWSKETGLDLAVTKAAVEAGPDIPITLDDTVIRSEQDLADAFTEDKVLPGKVDFARFVDPRFASDLNDIEGARR